MTQNIENQRIIEAAINKIGDYEAVKDNPDAVKLIYQLNSNYFKDCLYKAKEANNALD